MKKTWMEGGDTVPATKKAAVKIYWMLMNVKVWNNCCSKPKRGLARDDSEDCLATQGPTLLFLLSVCHQCLEGKMCRL